MFNATSAKPTLPGSSCIQISLKAHEGERQTLFHALEAHRAPDTPSVCAHFPEGTSPHRDLIIWGTSDVAAEAAPQAAGLQLGMLSADLTAWHPQGSGPNWKGLETRQRDSLLPQRTGAGCSLGRHSPFPLVTETVPGRRPAVCRKPACGWRRPGRCHAQSSRPLCQGPSSLHSYCLSLDALPVVRRSAKVCFHLVSKDPDAPLSLPPVYPPVGPGSSSCSSCWQTTSQALAWSQVSTGHRVIIIVPQISCMARSPRLFPLCLLVV